MGSVFDYYSSKRFKIGHNYGEHMDDIPTRNYKEISIRMGRHELDIVN